jgi:ribA/ribD-fused uncharacterized protein
MLCPNIKSPKWHNLVEKIGETNAWREFLAHGEIPEANKYEQSEGNKIQYSIRTKTTEEIQESLKNENVKTGNTIKYTNAVKSMLLARIGDITPNVELTTNPTTAFNNIKDTFNNIKNGLILLMDSVPDEATYNEVVSSPEYSSGEIQKLLPTLKYIKSYEDIGKALSMYSSLVEDFDKYKEYATADLSKLGVIIKNNKITKVDTKDENNDKTDDEKDEIEITAVEQGSQFADGRQFQTNTRDTASQRVKALLHTIKTGETEFGLPLYASPDDVNDDILHIGSKMKLTNFGNNESKLTEFNKALAERAATRTYLGDLQAKIANYINKGDTTVLNQIVTYATKAYANENILLYKSERIGNDITGISNVKIFGNNRDSVEEQVARDWVASHVSSSTGFYITNALNERFPNPVKVDQLKNIIEKAKEVNSDKKELFKNFFDTLGITFSDQDMNVIYNNLATSIRKGQTFDSLFAPNNMLDNIYKSYNDNLNTAFENQYGFQDQGTTMSKLATMYYDLNPQKYNVVSATSADGKNKYLYIETSHVENIKRNWETDREKGTSTHRVFKSAFAKPNLDFWNDAKTGKTKFKLEYFNGSRDESSNRDGKVRKNFTSKEQTVSMFLNHQTANTYISFTLSDKTSSLQTTIDKEFFIDSKKKESGSSNPMGKNVDFGISQSTGAAIYSEAFKNKLYMNLVAPEISRIQASIKAGDRINVEDFQTASKLFYIIPSINIDERLEDFRKDLYAGNNVSKYRALIGQVVLDDMIKSSEKQLEKLVENDVIRRSDKDVYTFHLFNKDYVNRFRQTGLVNRNLALTMIMDLKTNYMNAQVKNLQFFGFDPMNAFKRYSKSFTETDITKFTVDDKLKCINSTWDEFSKRAAGLIAPGSQGTWIWNNVNGKEYRSTTYKAVTAKDVKIAGSETTDAQEFTTVQEHIDFLMSEGDIPLSIWQSIHDKIEAAKNTKDKYYELTGKEMEYLMSPIKPVQFADVNEAENLNRIDYVKSSRFPLIPQNEIHSERNKLRLLMENNDIQSVNFASAKKLGRPSESIQLFDENNNFVIPDLTSKENTFYQTLTRDGLRKQQVVPDQKDHIMTISQMNRTLLDGLLESDGFKLKDLSLKGSELKKYKEAVRSKLFELATKKLDDELGDLSRSHRGLHKLLTDVIKSDTTGSYTSNDLRALELGADGKFKIPLEVQFKYNKYQSLINSLINKNIMLKVNGSSFIQVSGIGAKYTFSETSSNLKSGIIWVDKHIKDGEPTTLKYLRNEDGKIQGAQVIVSQYIRDEKGKLIDLSQFIITDETGRKILDTHAFTDDMFQMIASRIPNQSHPSMLPIEVVGFLSGNVQNSIIVPDGITGQMGSDFDVDKLFTYLSNTVIRRNDNGKIDRVMSTDYNLKSIDDINSMNEEQLLQLYKDIHWAALTHPEAFDKITSSVDLPEVKGMIADRNVLLEKYGISKNITSSLPLDFNTSTDRFNDNRSAKDGVAIFANYISAQADFQDKVITLGYTDKEGEAILNGIQVKLDKNKPVTELLYLGKEGKSESLTKDDKGKTLPLRTIGDVVNMMMTESVDNVKNQNLKEFNWDKKSMSAIGVFSMLTDEDGNAPSVEFSANLTSQYTIYKYFNILEQKQDSFGEYDADAKKNAFLETQDSLIKRIEKYKLLPANVVVEQYLSDPDRKDKVLDPATLKDMWVVGMALQDGGYKEYQDKVTASQPTTDTKLMKIAADLNFKSVNDMLLKYYTTQFDSLELFDKLDNLGQEFNTILGSVYTYTKGIGSDVFTTKQKINQLMKLKTSSNFLNLDKIAGNIDRDENTGMVNISPIGEIGNAINNSLIKAQSYYQKLFPISVSKSIDKIAGALVSTTGVARLTDVGKNKFVSTYNDAFRGIKNYLFTERGLELFSNAIEEREKLINGPTSIGARVAAIKQSGDKQLSSNGFLKNIDVTAQIKGGDAYVMSFKSPFGGDIDENIVASGFYELVNHPKEEIRQLAKDLAIYPFATGDAGNIGRFIPVEYLMTDKDFNKAMKDLNSTYSSEILIDNPYTLDTLIKQIVQNDPKTYSKKFKFGTIIEQGENDNTFKKLIKQSGILEAGVNDLSKVPSFKLKIGTLEDYAKANPKASGIVSSFKVPLSDDEKERLGDKALYIDFKYPDYVMITDSVVDNMTEYGEYNRDNNYLYKRMSKIGDPEARYQRIPILGYKNIREFDFKNDSLYSAIKQNHIDNSFVPQVKAQEAESVQSGNNTSDKIYSELGEKTQSKNVILPKDVDPEADNVGMSYTTAIDFWRKIVPEAMTLYNKSQPLIVAFRGDSKKTFLQNYKTSTNTIGNPFDFRDEAGDRKQQGITSTKKFIDWMITGNNQGNQNATEEYRQAIINDIKSGRLKNSSILYYEEKGYATHATALDYLINKYDWSNQETKNTSSPFIEGVHKTYEGKIEKLAPNQVYVFGSNPEGRHGAGSALDARNKFGAIYGNGRGEQGQSYALVTKNLTPGYTEKSTGITYEKAGEKSISKEQITNNIKDLYKIASENPEKEYVVAYKKDSKNLNGYSSQDMADMFSSQPIPSNMVFEKGFNDLVRSGQEKTNVQSSNTEQSIDKNNKINIYSTEKNGYEDLSNFAVRPFDVGDNYRFNTVEGAFQAFKFSETFPIQDDYQEIIKKLQTASGSEAKTIGKTIENLNKEKWDAKSSSIMKTVLKASFEQNPEALEKLLSTGNAELTHTQDNSKWKTEFPRLLMEVRNELRNTKTIDQPAFTESEEQQQKTNNIQTDIVKYGNGSFSSQFIVEHEGPYSGELKKIFYVSKGEKGKEVTDPGLFYKVSLKHDTMIHPQDVVTIKLGLNEHSYFIDMEGAVVSLQESSYGTQITSKDVLKRIFQEKDKKLEDKIVDQHNEDVVEKVPEGEKPKFEYNGTSVTTEFPLSEEQSQALKNLIDFVENKTTGEGEYNGVHTLEGYAGTGKTSIIGILEKYMKVKGGGAKFIYMAPTHAATVALGINIVKYGSKTFPITIQSSIRTTVKQNREITNFTRKFNDRATGLKNIIVLDEVSMLDNIEFSRLVATAKASGHRVIFIGDPKQITAVKTDNDDDNNKTTPTKNISKAFLNPNISKLNQIFRTKDNNILTVLTNIRNANKFNEQMFESTDTLKQLTKSDYNDELINDLKNNVEDTIILNYTNDGVAKANKSAREVLGYEGELKVGEKIVGYIGSETKEIEKGELANSVTYVVNNIEKSENGPITITATSKLLSHLLKMGMGGISDYTVFTYLNMSNADVHNYGLTSEQMEFNKNYLKQYLKKIHVLNTQYDNGNGRLEYVDYLQAVYLVRKELASINTGAKYIYNPKTDSVELYNERTHGKYGLNIAHNLKMDKGIDFGYAVTVHKSQGMSIPIVYVDMASIRNMKRTDILRNGELYNTEQNAIYYVALSRASQKLIVSKGENASTFSQAPNEYMEDSPLSFLDNNMSMFHDQIAINSVFGEDSTNISVNDLLKNIKANANPFNTQVVNSIIKAKPSPFKVTVDYKAENPGMYDLNSKQITINPTLAIKDYTEIKDKTQALHDVVIHEIMHHLTADLLNADPDTLSVAQKKYVLAIKNLFNDTQKKILNDEEHKEALKNAIEQTNKEGGFLSQADKSKYYGLTNVHDFVSMMMSDKGFRNFMNQTKYSGNKSIIDRFIDILATLLDLFKGQIKEDSVLHEGLSNIIGLLGTRVDDQIQRSIRTEEAFSFKENVMLDNFNDIIKLLDIKTKC